MEINEKLPSLSDNIEFCDFCLKYDQKPLADLIFIFKSKCKEFDVNVAIADDIVAKPSLCLHIMTRSNFYVKCLLECGACATHCDCQYRSESPLHHAVSIGSLEIVRDLLSFNADINALNRDGKTPLCEAVCQNKTEIAELLISYGADISVIDLEGWSALHRAIYCRHVYLVKVFLDYGADPNLPIGHPGRPEYKGYTPLHLAVRCKNLDIVKILLKNEDLKINLKSYYGATPFNISIEYKYLSFASLLLEKNADVNAQYTSPAVRNVKPGFTSLHLASTMGDINVVNFLIANHAYLDLTDIDGRTPLFIAVDLSRIDVTKVLLEKGASVNVKSSSGQSVLNCAVKQNNTNIVSLILNYEPDIDDQSNKEALKLASLSPYFWQGHIFDLLVDYGIKAHVTDLSSLKFLSYAVKRDKFEIIKSAFDNHVQTVFNYSKELLLLSAKSKSVNVMRLFLENGTDFTVHIPPELDIGHDKYVFEEDKGRGFGLYQDLDFYDYNEESSDYNLEDNDSSLFNYFVFGGTMPPKRNNILNSALYYIISSNNFEMARMCFLKKSDYDWNSLVHCAIANSNLEMIKYLFHVKNCILDDPFILKKAVLRQNYEIFCTALENTDCNINHIFDEGQSLIHFCQNAPTVCKLIECGVDINAQDNSGWTPLFCSVKEGLKEFTETLICQGADLSLKDKEGRSIIHIAALANCKKNLAFFINSKNYLSNNIDCRDNYGDTPILFSIRKSSLSNVILNIENLKTLIEHGADPELKDFNGKSAFGISLNHPCSTILVPALLQYNVELSINDLYVNDGVEEFLLFEKKILQYVFKIHSAGLHLNKEFLYLIKKYWERMSKWRMNCEKEIFKMKNKKLSGNITFYEILMNNLNWISFHVKRGNMLSKIHFPKVFKDKYSRVFPIYGHMLQVKLMKGVIRSEILNESIEVLGCLLLEKFPAIILYHISIFLSNNDLKNIIHSY